MRMLLLLVLALASGLSARAQDAKPRAIQRFTTTRASLELDGKPVGVLKSFGGGNAVAEVVTEGVGPSRVAGKHVSNIRFEPIVLEVTPSMAPEFLAFLQQWPNLKPLNGAVLIGDFNQNVVKRLEFSNAIVTEIAFPELNAAGKEAFSVQVTLTPEAVRTKPGSGRMQAPGPSSKAMLSNNFRLSVDGVDLTRVNKVESFVLKQTVSNGAFGGVFKEPQRITTAPEVGDLAFTLSEAGSESIQGWFDSFLIQGKRTQADEKSGKIELLGPDLKSVLFSITLRGMGIYRLAPDAIEANAETIRRVAAKLYVESATIDPIK